MAGPRSRSGLEPLLAEVARLRALSSSLQEELAAERLGRQEVERQRHALLARLARQRGESRDDAGRETEVAELEAERARLQRLHQDVRAAQERAEVQTARLREEMTALRAEIAVGEEERACLEEQIANLLRVTALLKAEIRLLRRRVGGEMTEAGAPT